MVWRVCGVESVWCGSTTCMHSDSHMQRQVHAHMFGVSGVCVDGAN